MHPLIFYRNWKRIASLCRSFHLHPENLVLDVGSGQNPNPRANVLCDRFMFDNTERNQDSVVIDRPLVIGDAVKLPFKDKAFDFVICSHLLEHVEYPEKVIAELQRVGKRGYIETPSFIWEKLHSFAFHRWYVSLENGRLMFREKSTPIHDAELKTWIQDVLGKSKLAEGFEREFGNLHLLTSLHWQGEIPFRIERISSSKTNDFIASSSAREEADPPSTASKVSIGTKTLRLWGKNLRKTSDHRLKTLEDVIELCACPDCHQELFHRKNAIHCPNCKRDFLLRTLQGKQIPDLTGLS